MLAWNWVMHDDDRGLYVACIVGSRETC